MGNARRRPKKEPVDLRTWRRIYATAAMAAIIVAGGMKVARGNKLSWARAAYEWADAMLQAGKVH